MKKYGNKIATIYQKKQVADHPTGAPTSRDKRDILTTATSLECLDDNRDSTALIIDPILPLDDMDRKAVLVNEMLRRHGFTTIRQHFKDDSSEFLLSQLYDILLSVMQEYENRSKVVQDLVRHRGRHVQAGVNSMKATADSSQLLSANTNNGAPVLSPSAPILIPVSHTADVSEFADTNHNHNELTSYKLKLTNKEAEIAELHTKIAQHQLLLTQATAQQQAQERATQTLRDHLAVILANDQKLKQARANMYHDLMGKGICDSRIQVLVAMLEEQRRLSQETISTLQKKLQEPVELAIKRTKVRPTEISYASKSNSSTLQSDLPSNNQIATQTNAPESSTLRNVTNKPTQFFKNPTKCFSKAIQCTITYDEEEWMLPNNALGHTIHASQDISLCIAVRSLPFAVCSNVLIHICKLMAITEPKQILPAVIRMTSIISTVLPRMEKFIKAVCMLVGDKVGGNAETSPPSELDYDNKDQFTHVLHTIKDWKTVVHNIKVSCG